MKFVEKVEKIKERIDCELLLMALACAGVASIISLGPEVKPNFTMPAFVIHIGIVVAVFFAVLIGGLLLEQKIIRRFQNGLKGSKKD